METDRLLGSSYQNTDTFCRCHHGDSSTEQTVAHTLAKNLCDRCGLERDRYTEIVTSLTVSDIKIYKIRWYILLVFSCLALVQGGLCNVWTVIAQSAGAAFGWSNTFISLMQGWLFITFLLTMYPISVFMDRKGLRPAMLFSACAVSIGAILRCLSTSPPYVTWLANVGHMFNGLAAPVMYTAGPVISALWFPVDERTTATAISTVSGFAGNAVCFLVGPLLIEQPLDNTFDPAGNGSRNISNINEIKKQILYCRYGECLVCLLLVVTIIGYFPSKPPKSPSFTSAIEKLDFTSGFLDLLRSNGNFWLIGLPYGLIISIYSVWTSLFDVNLQSLEVSETQAGWLGFWAVSSGCTAAILVGRVTDLATGHMKSILLCMNAGCVATTFCFMLIAANYIPFSIVVLYACAILQGIFCNGSIPLFYELAIEATYPVPEVAVSAMLNILFNVIPLIFIGIFFLPNIGTAWMNWVLYGSMILSFPMLLAFKEKYLRMNIDKYKTTEQSTMDIQS